MCFVIIFCSIESIVHPTKKNISSFQFKQKQNRNRHCGWKMLIYSEHFSSRFHFHSYFLFELFCGKFRQNYGRGLGSVMNFNRLVSRNATNLIAFPRTNLIIRNQHQTQVSQLRWNYNFCWCKTLVTHACIKSNKIFPRILLEEVMRMCKCILGYVILQ